LHWQNGEEKTVKLNKKYFLLKKTTPKNQAVGGGVKQKIL